MCADETDVQAIQEKLRYLISKATGVHYEDITEFSFENDVNYDRDTFNKDMSDLIKQYFQVDITPDEIGEMNKVDDFVERILQ